MPKAVVECLKEQYIDGIIVTKYGYSLGDIDGITIFEAGHPLPDHATLEVTKAILNHISEIPKDETILFLVSGGGSTLFGKKRYEISLAKLEDINKKLLASGANIIEISTIRKRFSKVKDGQFAQLCTPRQIQMIILSDVAWNQLDPIASEPVNPDALTSAEAQIIAEK